MKPRLLFGSIGWPCGLHEIASQVVRLGLGEAVIRQIQIDADGCFDDGFKRRLLEFRPHVVGFRAEGGQFETLCSLIENVRKCWETTIILGGPTATSHPVELLEQSGADYVFAGDAEESVATFLESARKPISRNFLPKIPGLAYSWGGRSVVNLPRENSISGTPVPCVDEKTLRENRLDWSLLENFTEPLDSLYLTGGRGCPGRCTFCARLHGQKIRTKTSSQIIEEIRGADRLVAEGRLRLTAWPLYAEVNDPALKTQAVSWCSIFDEDFFLDRRRAIRFLQLYEFYGFQRRYRLGFQTNPCSLLDREGRPDAELFYWIGRLKAMIQLGAESFHPEQLRRWNKRHSLEQIETVLDALDATGQDYNVFHLQSDYHTTLAELREAGRLLLRTARKHPRMRIASSPFMIPLYDTDIRRELGFLGRLKIEQFTDFETPHPEWMDSRVVELADEIDIALQDALYPQRREASLRRVEEILEKS